MKRRGKVLREPNSGPGLLMIDGQQFRFALDGAWQSEAPPRPGVNVEVELDNNMQVTEITVIPDSQMALQHAPATPADGVRDGNIIRRRLAAKLSALALIAAALVLVGWFSLRN